LTGGELGQGLKAHYYSAVGLACNRAKNGTPYLVVQYDQPPFGCVVCEWFALYTTQGRLLTHNDPPTILNGHPTDSAYEGPNNEEFHALYKKLGFQGRLKNIQFFGLKSQPGN
jgi:hypothetical protein